MFLCHFSQFVLLPNSLPSNSRIGDLPHIDYTFVWLIEFIDCCSGADAALRCCDWVIVVMGFGDVVGALRAV